MHFLFVPAREWGGVGRSYGELDKSWLPRYLWRHLPCTCLELCVALRRSPATA